MDVEMKDAEPSASSVEPEPEKVFLKEGGDFTSVYFLYLQIGHNSK